MIYLDIITIYNNGFEILEKNTCRKNNIPLFFSKVDNKFVHITLIKIYGYLYYGYTKEIFNPNLNMCILLIRESSSSL